mmetsp:Transcript_123503/g.357108  ORF Transcript_123503/g.357108 Transcript_123503/m.357108 type:complete len:252 (-) Transcript_123503:270-1025(-)
MIRFGRGLPKARAASRSLGGCATRGDSRRESSRAGTSRGSQFSLASPRRQRYRRLPMRTPRPRSPPWMPRPLAPMWPCRRAPVRAGRAAPPTSASSCFARSRRGRRPGRRLAAGRRRWGGPAAATSSPRRRRRAPSAPGAPGAPPPPLYGPAALWNVGSPSSRGPAPTAMDLPVAAQCLAPRRPSVGACLVHHRSGLHRIRKNSLRGNCRLRTPPPCCTESRSSSYLACLGSALSRWRSRRGGRRPRWRAP